MNITKNQPDALNAVITLRVEEADYRKKVDDVLSDYKKKARIDGFRPGMVPMGIIRKLYYKPILADEVNRMVSDELIKYLQTEKIQILGEPMPVESDKKYDFDTDKEFEFSFEVGLAPELSISVGDKDKIPFYTIKIEEKVIDEYVENVAKRFGELMPVDIITGNELLKGNLTECDSKGTPAEGGVHAEDVSLSLDIIKDETLKKPFLKKKAGDQIIFNLKKAYPSEVEVSAMLKIEKEAVEALSEYFMLELKEIKNFEHHEINQELFDKVYGEGVVNSVEEFRNKLREELAMNYERESNYRFTIDARNYYMEKSKVELPVAFLKKWLVQGNEQLTSENIDEEFKNYEEEFKWQLVKSSIVRSYEIRVSEEELFEFSFVLARNQFYQYGLHNMPDEYIEKYAREQLSKPEEARRLREQKYDEKVMQFIKDSVKLDKKDITADKFRKLFDK
jgi:trigger factor